VAAGDCASAAGAVSGADRRAIADGACVCVWRIDYSGHWVLPVWQPPVLGHGALRAQRGLCGDADPGVERSERDGVCAGGAGALLRRCGRPSDGEPGDLTAESQAAGAVRQDCDVRREPGGACADRVRLRRGGGGARTVLAGELPGLHRVPGGEAAAGEGVFGDLRDSGELGHEERGPVDRDVPVGGEQPDSEDDQGRAGELQGGH